jgi:hypothetical protein
VQLAAADQVLLAKGSEGEEGKAHHVGGSTIHSLLRQVQIDDEFL